MTSQPSGGLTLLVDAASLIYRAFFSTPQSVQAPDGSTVNAALGFLRMLARLMADRDPEFVCCALDDDWRPQWRVDLLPSYKAQRAEPDSAQQQSDMQISRQMPAILEILAGCGIAVAGHEGYEAEDVIGTLAARAPGPVAIVSGDRDLFQLVRDPDVVVLFPRRGVTDMDVVDEAYVSARYHIPGRAYRDYAVLRGDPSDGLPGVRGIGDKLAASLIARHGNLDAVVAAARSDPGIALQRVLRSVDYLDRARDVVTIRTDLPIPALDLTRPRRRPSPAAIELAQRWGLDQTVRRLGDALAAT